MSANPEQQQNPPPREIAEKRYFGTDGMRGRANSFPITPETVLRLAEASATFFRKGARKHRVVIGKDTRLSGYMLEPALTAGFVSMGFDVTLVGPMPTPAVAMLTRSMRADLGVMISASHNPPYDNGIKLFGADGFKLDDATEHTIESLMHRVDLPRAKPQRLGRAKRIEDAPGRYIEFVKNSFPKDLDLKGLKIAVDCANGAAYRVMPQVIWELGAELVMTLGVSPDGTNINKGCGASAPERLAKATKNSKADFGIAVDGDADRVVLVCSDGTILDGNYVIAAIVRKWQDSKQIRGQTVVSTIMANLGLERYLQGRSLSLLRTNVGDRYVVEAMRNRKCNVGGEPSGHIVLTDFSTTGDALVAALQICALLVRNEKPMRFLESLFDLVPQQMRNVQLEDATRALKLVQPLIEKINRRLNQKGGRLLVRPSGTEPLVRVMAEVEQQSLLQETLDEVCSALQTA